MKENNAYNNTSLLKLFEELKEKIEILSPHLLENEELIYLTQKIEKLAMLDALKNKAINKDEPFGALLSIQSELEESRANLISQIENTTNRIWSVDKNLNIKTINSNFERDYKEVFGIDLTPGINVVQNLPEPYRTVWKERYNSALRGERFMVEDKFELKNEFLFTETSFNPILINNKIVGVSCFACDISARKVAEMELNERTKELDAIFENAPILFLLIDENWKILHINHAGILNSGRERLNNIGLLSCEILNCVYAKGESDNCKKGVACKDCFIKKSITATLLTKQNLYQIEGSICVEVNGLIKKNQYLISTTYINLEDKERVLISMDDITEIKEAEEKIRKLSAAVDQSRATIVITDIKGNIEYANPQFSKTTGYDVDEAIGKNPRILKSDKTSSTEYKELWETIMNGKTWQGEFLNITKDNREYWESAIISPIFNANNEIISFIAIKEDITERKRIQEELVKSEKELRQMNEEKSRFFSILAHDLRGLVGSNYAYSDLLYSHFDTYSRDDLKENIQIIINSSKDSLSLLDNLLDWSKATMGLITITPKEIVLSEQTEKVVVLMSDLACKKNISIINNIKNTFISVTDVYVFQTIIRNLINNAIKFTHSGGNITISATRLSNNDIEISVSDTGVGINKTILDKLFKPGEKVRSLGTNDESGTGLGLMICDEMVKKLGGILQVESEVGKGSRFFFNLAGGINN